MRPDFSGRSEDNVQSLALADLKSFAATLEGGYPERYRAVLDRALSKHAIILSQRQLKDITGGGHNYTAAEALGTWLRDLRSKLGLRLGVGADVPPEFVQHIEGIVPELWTVTRALAGREFDDAKAALEAQVGEALSERDLARGELDRALQARCEAMARVETLEAQLAQAQQRSADLGSLLERAEAKAREDAAAAASLSDELGVERQRHAQQEEALRKEAARQISELREARQREVSALQRQHEHTVQALQAEKRELAVARDRAVAEKAEADVARARAERDAHELRGQAEKLAQDAETLREVAARAEAARSAAADQLAAMREELAATRAQVIDLGPLTQWVLDGMAAPAPQMHPAASALAQILAAGQKSASRASGASRAK